MIRLTREVPESYKAYVVREALTELGLIEPYQELPIEWKSLPFDELSVVTIPPLWTSKHEVRSSHTRIQAHYLAVGPEVFLTVVVLPDRIVAYWGKQKDRNSYGCCVYRVTVRQKERK